MYITKFLKRKDAASLIVAIPLAFMILQTLPQLTSRVTEFLTGLGSDHMYNGYPGPNNDWRMTYVQPIVSVIVQVILLEFILRAFVYLHPMVVQKKRK